MNQNEEHYIDHTKYLQDVLDLQLQALPSPNTKNSKKNTSGEGEWLLCGVCDIRAPLLMVINYHYKPSTKHIKMIKI
jgi:hypothetical protein